MRQDSSSFGPLLSFSANSSIFVIDLLTKMRLRLNSSIDVISFRRSARTAFTILGCSNSSFQPTRSSGSFRSILFIKSTSYYERLFWGIISLRTLSSLKYSLIDLYFLPWSKKGYSPLKAILCSTIPNENTSILEFPSFDCGI
jgi:hypothetical protein